MKFHFLLLFSSVESAVVRNQEETVFCAQRDNGQRKCWLLTCRSMLVVYMHVVGIDIMGTCVLSHSDYCVIMSFMTL